MAGPYLFYSGIVVLLAGLNVLWPRYSPSLLAVVSFFGGWLWGELAAHVLLFDAIFVGVELDRGALATRAGQVGLALHVLAALLFIAALRQSRGAFFVVQKTFSALPPLRPQAGPLDRGWMQLLVPIPVRTPGVERLRDVVYFADGRWQLKLDVFRRRGDTTTGRPALLYVHGGGWVLGDKSNQGLPMLGRLAAHGFVGFSINYRLSPQATFPDHIIDVKRAIAWVRAHAAEYGADGSRIFLAGGSAGGHLAALAAVTPGKPEWQPGFEDADTSVTACVSLYGIYDFTDGADHWHNPGLRRLLEKHVFKARFADDPDPFLQASPLHWVKKSAPPFLVVQGTHDTLVPVAEARRFVAALTSAGVPCAYLELLGAQHAFEVFPSLRTQAVGEGIERFLTSLLAPR